MLCLWAMLMPVSLWSQEHTGFAPSIFGLKLSYLCETSLAEPCAYFWPKYPQSPEKMLLGAGWILPQHLVLAQPVHSLLAQLCLLCSTLPPKKLQLRKQHLQQWLLSRGDKSARSGLQMYFCILIGWHVVDMVYFPLLPPFLQLVTKLKNQKISH